jgi:hypothetical protein
MSKLTRSAETQNTAIPWLLFLVVTNETDRDTVHPASGQVCHGNFATTKCLSPLYLHTLGLRYTYVPLWMIFSNSFQSVSIHIQSFLRLIREQKNLSSAKVALASYKLAH